MTVSPRGRLLIRNVCMAFDRYLNPAAGPALPENDLIMHDQKEWQVSIAHIRKDYQLGTLSEQHSRSDPIEQFAEWFGAARRAELPDMNAMTLSTVGKGGRPSSRTVLIKEFGQAGFTWFTNYTSRKGEELDANPHAALLFYWPAMERQVEIEGVVGRVPPAESDAYFLQRPIKSRISAITSDQSKPVASRAVMEEKYAADREAHGDNPARPDHWGGYLLVPDRIEFWQGGSARLHDRLLYTRNADGLWQRNRLQP